MLHAALEKQCRKSRIPVDFTRAYWTPPLTPKLAYETERNQIENTVGLRSLVSLTDHDNIEAPLMLRTVRETAQTPISLEWSVPFAGTIFHLGVHNLPSGQAQAIVDDLAAYTRNPNERRLGELLAMLDAFPERAGGVQSSAVDADVRGSASGRPGSGSVFKLRGASFCTRSKSTPRAAPGKTIA